MIDFLQKSKKTILVLKRALEIPYVNRFDFFAFWVYKNVSQKSVFCIGIRITMTAIIEKQRARFYIQKSKKNYETFLYTKSRTLSKI